PDLVEYGWRNGCRILHHHRYGPWHSAGDGGQRRALRHSGRVSDRGGYLVLVPHCPFLRPDRMDSPAQGICQGTYKRTCKDIFERSFEEAGEDSSGEFSGTPGDTRYHRSAVATGEL